VFDAISRITKEEGVRSLWKGATPTVVRAMSLNLGMLASYEESKDRLSVWLGPQRASLTWFLSGLISGAIASVMSLPFDNVKTKL